VFGRCTDGKNMTYTLRSIRSSRTLRVVMSPLMAAAAVFTSIAPSLAKTDPAPAQAIPGITSIAYFPATTTLGANGSVAASMLDGALKLKLAQTGAFSVTTYSVHLPSIDRALNVDNSLTSADVQPPITDPTTTLKIARIMGTDGYLMDEVDSYQEDPNTHAISITISGNLYNTNTGSSLRTFAVTGTAAPTTPDQGATSVTKLAVENAAAQIVTSLNLINVKAATIPRTNYHQNGGTTVLLAILAASLLAVVAHNQPHSTPTVGGTAVSSSSGSTNSGGSGTPPAPPI
jgi:hypothetical protein